eukprot:scaffold107877_cov44-Phaeocystis_antarctica.AAC.1
MWSWFRGQGFGAGQRAGDLPGDCGLLAVRRYVRGGGARYGGAGAEARSTCVRAHVQVHV